MVKFTFFLCVLLLTSKISSFSQGDPVPTPRPITTISYGNGPYSPGTGGGSYPGPSNTPSPGTNSGGTTGPGGEPSGYGAERARQAARRNAESRARFNTRLNNFKAQSTTITRAAAEILTGINQPQLKQRAEKYARLDKHLKAARQYIKNIEDCHKIVDTMAFYHYNTMLNGELQVNNEERNYQDLTNCLNESRIIDNFITGQSELKQVCEVEENKRDEFLAGQLNKLNKTRAEFLKSQSLASSDALYAMGATAISIEGTAKLTKSMLGLFYDPGKVQYLSLTEGLDYAQAFVDELAESWIGNNQPITKEMITDINRKALIDIALGRVDKHNLLYLPQTASDISDWVIKYQTLQDQHDFALKQRREILEQIDDQIRRTKKLKEINRINKVLIFDRLNKYMNSTEDVSPAIPFRPLALDISNLPLESLYLNVEIVPHPYNPTIYILKDQKDLPKIKSRFANLQNITNRYQTAINQAQPNLKRLLGYQNIATSAFNEVKSINAKNQLIQFNGNPYNATELIVDYNKQLENYSKGMKAINQMIILQQFLIDSTQMVKRLASLVFSRDAYFTSQLRIASTIRSSVLPVPAGQISQKTKKKSVTNAKAQSIKLIDGYLNYSTKDFRTRYFITAYPDFLKVPIENDVLTHEAITTYLDNYQQARMAYDEKIWSNLYVYLENSASFQTRRKLNDEVKQLNELKNQKKITIIQYEDRRLQTYLDAFNQSIENHKKILKMMAREKVAYLL